jgi:DNA-binding response OmpR family regulator
MARQDSKRLILLHVEDEDDDAILFSKACERAQLPVELCRVADGAEARAYLLGQGIYADRFRYPFPQVVVLDLKMPLVDGFEFLKWVRGPDGFATLPVLVFTSSLSREDKTRALAEGASSYFVKPASFDALVAMVEVFRAPDQRN